MTAGIDPGLEDLVKFVSEEIKKEKEINAYHHSAVSVVRNLGGTYEIIIPVGISASKNMMNELKYQQLKEVIVEYCKVHNFDYKVGDPIVKKGESDLLPTLYIPLEPNSTTKSK